MANEKRLIDANALMDDVEMDGALYACLGAVDDVRFLVDSQPTVDAVEVVHARWEGSAFNIHGEYEEKCSHCKQWSTAYGSDFCPNCGAKMDGGNEDV